MVNAADACFTFGGHTGKDQREFDARKIGSPSPATFSTF